MRLTEEDKNKINEIKKMRDELIRIKNYADNDINKRETIDLYHKWRTESEVFLEKYFTEDNRWIKKFNSYPTEGNGYVLIDNYFTPQLSILNLLLGQIESDIMDTKSKKNNIQEVFISHSSNDEKIVKSFVDLILDNGLSIKPTNIFCTSLDGMKIKSGEEWRDHIKERLINAKVTLLIITPNYKESEVCLNEMGAAWVLNGAVIPLAVEPIDYKSVGVIMEVKQIEKILDEKALDRIKDIVREKLNIDPKDIPSDRWTTKKNEFITEVKDIINNNPFKLPLVREEFDKQTEKIKELNITVKSQLKEKEELKRLNEKLELAKDKSDVLKIKKESGLISDFDEFEKLRKKVSDSLQDLAPIIVGIFFKEFTSKNISIKWKNYEDDIDLAIAEDVIDDELNPNWDINGNPLAIAVKDDLDELRNFMTESLPDDFYELYKNKYDTPFDLNNINFWSDVLDAKIRIN